MAFDAHASMVGHRTGRAHHAPHRTDINGETKMQNQNRLIGFTGLKGSGKDTAGQVFVDHGWKKISFAEPLKAMMRTLLEMRGATPKTIYRMLEGDLKEAGSTLLLGNTARHAMQTLGTEWGRDLIDPDLWIDTFNRRAHNILAAGDGVVVTDVRFPNEVEAIRKLGGKVFRVNRGSAHESESLHPSEAMVYALDVTGDIQNELPTAIDFQVYINNRFF